MGEQTIPRAGHRRTECFMHGSLFFLLCLHQILFTSVVSSWPGFLMSLSSSSSALLSALSCMLPPSRCSGARSQGWLPSASSSSQRLLYLFLKHFLSLLRSNFQHTLARAGSSCSSPYFGTSSAALGLREMGTDAELGCHVGSLVPFETCRLRLSYQAWQHCFPYSHSLGVGAAEV